jgi:hypothetical protein
MPYQDPGYLTEEEYLAMTAFLARAHGVWDGTPLTAENAGDFRLRPTEATAIPEPATPSASPTEIPDNSQDTGRTENSDTIITFVVGLAVGIIGSVTLIILLLKRRVK